MTTMVRTPNTARLMWYAYFLLGAGILAPWNAFLTAMDYYMLRFPGVHVDRIITVAYLPTCLLFLVVCLLLDELPWFPRTYLRVLVCYATFTAIQAILPLVDFVLLKDQPASGQQGGSSPALLGLLAAVILVGALDGGCQGAVFSDAAQHGAQYAQAVASGTACSGLLISVLRLVCKAGWQIDSHFPAAGLRASTVLYFLLSGVITLACTHVHCSVLPKLHIAAGQALHLPAPGSGLQLADYIDDTETNAIKSHEVDSSDRLVTSSLFNSLLHSNEASQHANHRSSSVYHDDDSTKDTEDQPLLHTNCDGGSHQHVADIHSVEVASSRSDPVAWPHVAVLRQLHTAHSHQVAAQCGSVVYDVPNQHGEGHDHSSREGGTAQRLAALQQCLTVLWPSCVSLFLTYACTLAIFPGFLSEDIHSDVLGDWYPLLVITAFNAADMVGKILGPDMEHNPKHSRAAAHETATAKPSVSSFWQKLLSSMRSQIGKPSVIERALLLAHDKAEAAVRHPSHVAWLALGRGILMLLVFMFAAMTSAPAWIIFPATVKLGMTNGWLTVAAMSGPSVLLPKQLVAAGEGLLVVSLATGLLVGAMLGWVWLLIPSGTSWL